MSKDLRKRIAALEETMMRAYWLERACLPLKAVRSLSKGKLSPLAGAAPLSSVPALTALVSNLDAQLRNFSVSVEAVRQVIERHHGSLLASSKGSPKSKRRHSKRKGGAA